MLKYLVEHGADVNAVDGYGHTPLFLAVRYMDTEICKYLVVHGADRKALDEEIDQMVSVS